MRKIRLFLSLIILACVISGCNNDNNDTIKLDIDIISEDASSVFAEQIGQMHISLTAWENNHPQIDVTERERLKNYDIIYYSALGEEHIPDVFVSDCLTGRLLARDGLVCDVTRYAPDVNDFCYYGRVYAFPLFGESVSIVVYDPDFWSAGDPIGVNVDDRYTMVNCILGGLLGDEPEQEWLNHLTSGDQQTSFTDREFIDALNTFRDVIDHSVKYDSQDSLFDAFINGDCHAVIVSGDNVYRLLDQVSEQNQTLYNRIEFAPYVENFIPMGVQYGVFVRTGLNEERFDECVSLALSLTASYQIDVDDTYSRLAESIDNASSISMLTKRFVWAFWGQADQYLNRFVEGDITSEELAFALQNCYEQYYTEYA